MAAKDISLPLVVLFLLKATAQPTTWSDVCIMGSDAMNCYLWTGAPFPFNDIGSFVKNNPLCSGQNMCNIFVSPVLINCLVSPNGDNTMPPLGCQFYKPTTSSNATDYNVILCNLNINCSDPDPGPFLKEVWGAYMIALGESWQDSATAYAVSSLFGGVGATPPLNSFLIHYTGIDINNPPPVRIRWDGPLFVTNSLTIDSMFAVANGVDATTPYMPLNIQIASPQCTLFTVQAKSVSFQNILFYVDPQCAAINTRGTIVYNLQDGIGSVQLTNLSSSIAVYPLVYVLDNYQPDSALIIDTVGFSLDLDGNMPPSPPPFLFPVQSATPFAVLVLQFAGTVIVDQFSPGLAFGTAQFPNLQGNFINAKQWTAVDPILLGCPPTIWSNSVCDQKKSVDLGLIVSTSLILATLVVYAGVEIWRRRNLTLHNATMEARDSL